MENKSDESRKIGIYLLPNLFTTASIFAGFYAIVAAMNGHFSTASVAIFIAAIMDTLDGRVARLTNTESHFGAEYDSLADIISFGVAPALIVYTWAFKPIVQMEQVGWLIAFIFVAAAALRLAKFNSNMGTGSKRYFSGLPVPAAASFLVALVWVGNINKFHGMTLSVFVGIATLFVAIMMVSNIKFRSFKDYDVKGKVGFTTVVFVVLIFACIAIDPAHVLFFVFGLYAFSGPVVSIWCKVMGIDGNEKYKDDDAINDESAE
ncbi:MAG: CDP-diacylglycerol--serine O-phosphatidyltransferase [Francisellaceae bacterium]|jgi:CDP-diacylglycerol--serine O-phosphatidyltransferase